MARRATSRKAKLGRKLDSVLFGIPENRSKFMRTGQRNAAQKRRLYRLGYAAALKNPGDATKALYAVEKTVIFRQAAVADLAGAREFFLAGYHDGLGEKQNPGGTKGEFQKCVEAVAAKGGAYDPRAVCASMERRKYGQEELTRRAVAGKKAARRARGNKGKPATAQRFAGIGMVPPQQAAQLLESGDWNWSYKHHAWVAAKKRNPRNPRNPLDTAQDAYTHFHGEAPKHTTVVEEKTHFHTHVWEVGKLVLLRVVLPSDRRQSGLKNTVDIEFDYEGKSPTRLTANEKGTQLFIDGGDQRVDVGVFGIDTDTVHERELLGYLRDVWYFTDKKHLGKQGGLAVYKHRLGEEGGELPVLVYRTLDKRLEIVGGSYTIPDEGVRN